MPRKQKAIITKLLGSFARDRQSSIDLALKIYSMSKFVLDHSGVVSDNDIEQFEHNVQIDAKVAIYLFKIKRTTPISRKESQKFYLIAKSAINLYMAKSSHGQLPRISNLCSGNSSALGQAKDNRLILTHKRAQAFATGLRATPFKIKPGPKKH